MLLFVEVELAILRLYFPYQNEILLVDDRNHGRDVIVVLVCAILLSGFETTPGNDLKITFVSTGRWLCSNYLNSRFR